MEHATGGSLLDFVRQRKRLDEPTARRFICQAAAGIEYCHAHGVIHRDIKLENLLLDEHDDLRLIDFGLAAILPPGGENKRLKVHCGSPSYAGPAGGRMVPGRGAVRLSGGLPSLPCRK